MKFSGSKEQSISYILGDYEVCSHHFELSPEKQQKFFVNVFGGPVWEYFFENTAPEMPFQEMVNVMLKKYEADADLLDTQAELEGITTNQVMKEKDVTDSGSSLTHLVDKINIRTPHALPHFRSDEHKKRFLCNALLT